MADCTWYECNYAFSWNINSIYFSLLNLQANVESCHLVRNYEGHAAQTSSDITSQSEFCACVPGSQSSLHTSICICQEASDKADIWKWTANMIIYVI